MWRWRFRNSKRSEFFSVRGQTAKVTFFHSLRANEETRAGDHSSVPSASDKRLVTVNQRPHHLIRTIIAKLIYSGRALSVAGDNTNILVRSLCQVISTQCVALLSVNVYDRLNSLNDLILRKKKVRFQRIQTNKIKCKIFNTNIH